MGTIFIGILQVLKFEFLMSRILAIMTFHPYCCTQQGQRSNIYFGSSSTAVAQSVTCLATDACLTADPGVASSIPARYHTFVEIDHEIISTVILLLPLIYSRRVVVSYKRKYVHKLLVNRLLKPAQEKVWSSELTVPQCP